MKHILGLVFTFISFSFTNSGELFAHVEKTYFLKGRIAEKEIAIKMLCYDESPMRQILYFFQDTKKDHLLIGKLNANVWSFVPEVEQAGFNVNQKGTLNIMETKDGIWKGTWSDSNGKTSAVELDPLLTDSIVSKFSYLPYVTELDPYERYRLSNINFNKTKTEKQTKDLFCNWYLEKESGVLFFRLTSNNNKIKTDSINTALETINLSLIQNYFRYDGGKMNTNAETTLHLLTNQLVSFTILSKSIYSSTKTVQAKEFLTLDISTGEQVNLEDIIWFNKGAAKPASDDLFKIYKYRKEAFAPKIFRLLQELNPTKMKTDSCNINKAETWALPAWNLTNKGLALSFYTNDDCDVASWAIIPYKKLEPFMEEKYSLKGIK